MKWLEKESFESIINNGYFVLSSAGPLFSPVKRVEIKRNKSLNLILTTISADSATSSHITHPAGTVRNNLEKVELINRFGWHVVINGVEPYREKVRHKISSEEGEREQKSTLHSLEVFVGAKEKSKYIVDWLLVGKDIPYIWPEWVAKESKTEEIYQYGKELSLEIKKISQWRSSQSNCLKLNIDGVLLYLSVNKRNKEKKTRNASILYSKYVDENFRKKIRDTISFVLGIYLVHLGSSSFDEEWELISAKAKNGYSLDGKIFDAPILPPAPLGFKYQRELSESVAQKAIENLYNNYDKLKFDHLSWSYWHAICAPIHMAAVHFSASIEMLQKIHMKEVKVSRLLIDDRRIWKEFLNDMLEILKGKNLLEDQVKKILFNKINDVNIMPASIISDKFFKAIGLELTEFEKAAFNQRNALVHGYLIEEDRHIGVIKNTKILKLIFHQMLLRITNASEYYYDYYSLNFPIKNISDGILEN